jgi:hypothetical protein
MHELTLVMVSGGAVSMAFSNKRRGNIGRNRWISMAARTTATFQCFAIKTAVMFFER